MKKILIVDDEASHRMMVRAVLEDASWLVFEAASAEEALSLLELGLDSGSPQALSQALEKTLPQILPQVLPKSLPDVVLLDMHLPGIDGQAALEKIRLTWADLPVVMLTAFGSVGAAVEAMKKGAFDYLTKPADNDEICAVLARAWNYASLLKQQNKQRLKPLDSEKDPVDRLVGQSPAMLKLHSLITQAGPSEATVLILGESGTGKELIAESLHAMSLRSKAAFIKVNCAALPANLLESELFGHEKGAFTGASKDKPGRFVLADGGTIFLDEIGELPLELQAKFLRVLQERIVEPLGSVRSIAIDIRILAATNRDLRQEVQAGRFREDLYFRLNVLEIYSPPLRERLADLPELCARLLYRLSQKNKKEIRGVGGDFLETLAKYSWPGNVRELENILERALILSRGDNLDVATLPEYILKVPDPINTALVVNNTASESIKEVVTEPKDTAIDFDGHLDLAEKQALNEVLTANQGHREKTADALGISRRTLQYKLKKYGLNKK